MIKEKDGKVTIIGTKSRGNVFWLTPTKITCLVAMVDDGWHQKFCHIKFDSIVKTSIMFTVR